MSSRHVCTNQDCPITTDADGGDPPDILTKSRYKGPFESINSASTSHFEHIRSSVKTNEDVGLQDGNSYMRSKISNANTKQSRPRSPTLLTTMNSYAVTTTGQHAPLHSPSKRASFGAAKTMSPRGRHAHLGISRLDDLERRSRPTSPNKRVSDRRMMRPDRSASPRRPTNEKQERFRRAGIERFRRAGMGIFQTEKAAEKSNKRRVIVKDSLSQRIKS